MYKVQRLGYPSGCIRAVAGNVILSPFDRTGNSFFLAEERGRAREAAHGFPSVVKDPVSKYSVHGIYP